MKTCEIDGCENKHEARGYCKKHYRSFYTYGDASYIDNKKKERDNLCNVNSERPKSMSTKGTCQYDGCDSPIKSRGYCEKHYARLRRNGTMELQKKRSNINPDICLAMDCENEPLRHGMCGTHLINIREIKTPFKAKVRKLCGVNNCENIHFGHGLCKEHFYEWKAIVKEFKLAEYLNLKGQE